MGLELARKLAAGHALRPARHAALTRYHHRRIAIARARHRRQHRPLQPDGRRHAALAPGERPAAAGAPGQGDASGITDDFGATHLYSYPFYRELQKQNQVFSETAAIFSMHNDVHGTVSGRNQAEPMHVQLVSGTISPLLGVQAIIGRTLTDQDDSTQGDHPVAVVSYSWWKKSLARDPNVLNRTLKIGDTTYSIVGVAPPEFFGTEVGESPDIWIPMSMVEQVPPHFKGAYSDNSTESLLHPGPAQAGCQHGPGHNKCESALSADPAPPAAALSVRTMPRR